MYEYIDRHPADLQPAEQFILAATRRWMTATRDRTTPMTALYRSFAQMGAAGALTDFHLVMFLVHREISGRIRIAPLEHGQVWEDEAVLIALWRAVAEGADHAKGTLERLIGPEAVQLVFGIMANCTTSLALSGFDLSTVLHAESSPSVRSPGARDL